MKQLSAFYTRHALLILCVTFFLLPLVGFGAAKALQTNTNDVREWLPKEYKETSDYDWFKQHFGNEEFVVVTWAGCNTNDERLALLIEKFKKRCTPPAVTIGDGTEEADEAPPSKEGAKPPREGAAENAVAAADNPTIAARLPPSEILFHRVISGRSMLEDLSKRPVSLSTAEIVDRFHGVLFGREIPPEYKNEEAALSPEDVTLDPDQIAAQRLTCIVVTLTDPAKTHLKATLAKIRELAIDECGIPAATLKLGGPPVVNVAIDESSAKSLRQLAALSGVVGLFLAWVFFKSVRITLMVFITAGYSAAASLAMVWLGGDAMNAILITMAPLVYVAGMSGSIHLANYYRDAVRDGGASGAAGRAMGLAWLPLALATSTTAVGLLSLLYSELSPIQLFGKYSAIGIVVSSVLLFFGLPAALELFAPKQPATKPGEALPQHDEGEDILGPGWQWFCSGVIRHQGLCSVVCILMLVVCGWGMTRMETSIKIMRFFSQDSEIIHNYHWLEDNLGALVPMEVIVKVDPEVCENAADSNPQTLDVLQRLEMVREAQHGVRSLPDVKNSLSAVNFARDIPAREPGNEWPAEPEWDRDRSTRNKSYLARYRQLKNSGYLRTVDGEELWRISLRISSLNNSLDYGVFKDDITKSVEGILDRQRHAMRIERLAAAAAAADKAGEANLKAALDAALAALKSGDETAVAREMSAISAADLPVPQRDAAVAVLANDLGSYNEGIHAVYTGMVPVVYKAQRSLLDGLIFGFTTDLALIVIVIIVLMRHWSSGFMLALTSLFPTAVVFGAMGLLHIVVDIGTVMTPSVALGVTVDDVVHFLLKFKKGIMRGESRQQAVMTAYKGCARAMYQSWGVIGLGLAMFAFSSFTPTMRFGALMVSLLTVGLAGNLIFLPALMAGPLGGIIERSIKRQMARQQRHEPQAGSPPPDDALPAQRNGRLEEVYVRPERRGVMTYAKLFFGWLWTSVASLL